MAFLLLLQAGLMWSGRSELVQQLGEQQQLVPADATARAQQMIVANTGIAVVLAAAYFGFGAAVLKRHSWARVALTAFALVHLVLVLGSGAVFSVHTILLVLGGTAAVLMWRQPSTEWLTGER
ncbi:hypothetical protein OU415_21800 [Saccharopolyspora sp. WRP15-2]|uniref:Uncharacterized protein n=1 Tax=Saccharopolyspora oryzae TaxID=2997343 RepID=A0ABT4V2P8_9PSEU|nr:hypothetical protein [Saccharopolyspora oryzae]MDA3628083.1 hypothetical protein [Saccharopolyspora oryzae]